MVTYCNLKYNDTIRTKENVGKVKNINKKSLPPVPPATSLLRSACNDRERGNLGIGKDYD